MIVGLTRPGGESVVPTELAQIGEVLPLPHDATRPVHPVTTFIFPIFCVLVPTPAFGPRLR